MAMSLDITLPKDQEPVFPDWCVVCRRTEPDDTVRVTEHSIGWWTWILWTRGRKYSIDVPACKRCSQKLRIRLWVSVAIYFGIVIAAFWLFDPWISKLVPRAFRRWAYIGTVLVCVIPYACWELIFPPAFDLTVYSDRVDYEFRDAIYAIQFARLNDALDQLGVGSEIADYAVQITEQYDDLDQSGFGPEVDDDDSDFEPGEDEFD